MLLSDRCGRHHYYFNIKTIQRKIIIKHIKKINIRSSSILCKPIIFLLISVGFVCYVVTRRIFSSYLLTIENWLKNFVSIDNFQSERERERVREKKNRYSLSRAIISMDNSQ